MLIIEILKKTQYLSVVCPNCGERQFPFSTFLCRACLDALPDANGILKNIKDRVSYSNDEDPWGY